MENTNNRETISPIEEQEKKKIDRFNVWAFLFPFIWALAKKLYMDAFITLALALVGGIASHFDVSWLTVIALVAMFIWKMYLGFDGNREVWRLKNETDEEVLGKRKKQEKFAIGGIIIAAIVYLILIYLAIDKVNNETQYYQNYHPSYYDYEIVPALSDEEDDTIVGYEDAIF